VSSSFAITPRVRFSLLAVPSLMLSGWTAYAADDAAGIEALADILADRI
jgi:hypothetical protein